MSIDSLSTPSPSQRLSKPPRQILTDIFAFSPHRETLGGTAYFIIEKSGNILVDCPPWDQTTQDFIENQGGIAYLFLTHRGGIGQKVKEMQQKFTFTAIIQEQEAYLLPEITVKTFQESLDLSSNCRGIWTPGFSPGSACLYYNGHGGVLFSGRHLLPDQQGNPVPLRMAKTFHWPRQLRSLDKLRQQFTTESLAYICPGANTGFLRGKALIERGYELLSNLDLNELKSAPIPL